MTPQGVSPSCLVSYAGELPEVLSADLGHRCRRVVQGPLVALGLRAVKSLTPEERALLFVYCSEHVVARCLSCDISYRYPELAADLFDGRTNLCPRCRVDLTENVRGHLFSCVTLPSEIRQRTQDVRDAAQRLIKQSQQAIDQSDVLIREKEALLHERQQALRAAMARRAGDNK